MSDRCTQDNPAATTVPRFLVTFKGHGLKNNCVLFDGIAGDQAAGQIERPQQLGDGGDFVRFLGALSLTQHRMIGGAQALTP